MINKIFIAAGMFFMMAAVAQASVGGDQLRTTPGHKYLDELTLRGSMTAGRKVQEEGFSQQMALFQFQQAVNRDSEQFQALTNIQKAKHDAAIAAIQNVR